MYKEIAVLISNALNNKLTINEVEDLLGEDFFNGLSFVFFQN